MTRGAPGRRGLLPTLARFGGSSLLATSVDYTVFAAVMHAHGRLLPAFVIGRITALAVNFAVNRRAVFKSDAPVTWQLLRFLAAAGLVMTLHWSSARLILHYWEMHPVPARMVGESLIFLCSFALQRRFVFGVSGSRCKECRREAAGSRPATEEGVPTCM